jgi:glycosyltransferase involved in cell wall biosynthesis
MTGGAATDPSRGARVRVAVVSSVHRWNDTRIFVKQAASLAANGYDVTLAAIGDQGSPFEASGVRVVPLPRRRRALRWLTWLSILRIVVSQRAKIVHAHDPELIPLVLLLKLTGRFAICDIHENVAEQVLHKEWIPRLCRVPLSRLLKGVQRSLPRMADAVILAEDSYVRDYPARANVSVIRNFPLLPPGSKQDYRSDTFGLIYVGDVRGVRGIREYVTITQRLVERGVPAQLRIVGSFADREEERQTHELVRQLGLEQRVVFAGRRPPEEIPVLVQQSDLGLALLHPIGNYRESYPTKMFEYMAAGIPVIASNFALWRDVLVPNECGKVVDPLNVEEAAAAALEYWTRPDLRERHGQNGRAAVLRRYHWGVEAPHLLRVYAALAGGEGYDHAGVISAPTSTPDRVS